MPSVPNGPREVKPIILARTVGFASLYSPYRSTPLLHRRRDPLQRCVHPPRLLDLLHIQYRRMG